MKEKILILLASSFSAAITISLVILSNSRVEAGIFFVAIVLGGIGGGFTLGLIGGERYGLKLPGKVGSDHKFDPGFLGDIFVGLMSSFLGIGVASRTLKTDLFSTTEVSAIELWFVNFSIAYICGFLGLRFIKGVSEKFLQEAQIKENSERLTKAEGTNAFLSAQTALSAGQFDEAENLYHKAINLDKENEARARIGLARVHRRRNHLGEAIAELSTVINSQPKEPRKERLAVAYWNRACYRALLGMDLNSEESTLIFNDLKQAIQLQPEFRHDLLTEADLQKASKDPRMFELMPKGISPTKQDGETDDGKL